jgi:hypothetical protein
LLKHEMDWTVLFFRTMERMWLCRAHDRPKRNPEHASGSRSAPNLSQPANEHEEGLVCYANKQTSMWSKLADHASVQFSTSKMHLERK